MKIFQSTDKFRYLYRCPGCGNFHTYYVGRPNVYGGVWRFNGDLNYPSFDSTLHIKYTDSSGHQTICHSSMKLGRITFHPDTTHRLRSTTVKMDELLYS
jgi:hypothetical protein